MYITIHVISSTKKLFSLFFLSCKTDFYAGFLQEIKDEDLKRFLSTRFKESKATRVILAHNRFLTNLAIEILFSALPT
jgi:hypothetical protein